jgi:hypothetical protein
MFPRALLLGLTSFWVIMNVLLWRAEYGRRASVGSTVPAHVVWEKILTAPDSSSLTIFHKGKKVGFCHWITSVGEDLSRMSATEAPPEGMVRRIVNYRLELDGNLVLGDVADRLRFDSHLNLGSDQKWQELNLRLNLRSAGWEVRSVAAEQAVRVSWQEDSQKFNRIIKFSELEHPEALVQEFGGPVAAGLLAGLGLAPDARRAGLPALDLQWEARLESVKLGHSPVRAYRLEARLLDRFTAVVFVSRVGELLRVELPDGIVLTNDQLGGN